MPTAPTSAALPDPAPAPRASLVEQVIGQLRAQIAAGAWPLGSQIPTETELTDSLRVGRNTVREAVRALVHAGILESRQGAGTFVRARSELAGAVQRLLAERGDTDIWEVRRALEVEAARLAASRRTPADLARLRTALRARDTAWAAGDLAEFTRADVEFHVAVVRAAGNAVLSQLYGDIADAVHVSIGASVDADVDAGAGPGSAGFVDHAPLAAAIEAGDVERAMREAAAFL